MKYNELVESIVDSLLEDGSFWNDVKKELAIGYSLDPNHLGLQNTAGKSWDVIHHKGEVGKFPVVLGSGRTLQHAFSDALARTPPKSKVKSPDSQGNLF